MDELLITGVRVLAEFGTLDGWLHVTEGRIAAVGDSRPPPLGLGARRLDLGGLTVAPGFIDVHVHGAMGHETMDADPAGLRAMARYFATHGVTAFLPTTWTDTRVRTMNALEAVAGTMGDVDGGAQILGAHMEGPYLTSTRCGAQNPAHIRPADPIELEALLSTGAPRLLTIAPEREENLDAIRACVDAGVSVSLGHTEASLEHVTAAVAAGATHVTHLFNAMAPLDHRELGTVGSVLDEQRLRAELICDLVHVHPALLRLALRAKGVEGLVVVTDAVGPTGLAEGTYPLGDRWVRHERDAMWLEDGKTLAGSALTFDRAVRNLASATGLGIEHLWPACSQNGATAAGVANQKGRIAPGLDADLVVLNEDLEVRATFAKGELVYQVG